MIAVTFALPQESSTFVQSLTQVREIRPGPLPWLSGRAGEVEITVCHTGIGRASATAIVEELLGNLTPRYLISAGFAGALERQLKIGDLLIAENFSDPVLSARVAAALRFDSPRRPPFVGVLTTQDVVVEHRSDKAALAQKTGALAVDMETAFIHTICTARALPMVSLRAISDLAEQTLPLPFAVWFDLRAQRPRRGAVLAFLALHPSSIAPFARFVAGIHRARRSLGNALRQCAGL